MLHLNIWLHVARIDSAIGRKYNAIHNVQQLAEEYADLLEFSMTTWAERGPNHFPVCSWTGATCSRQILDRRHEFYGEWSCGVGFLKDSSNQDVRYMGQSVS